MPLTGTTKAKAAAKAAPTIRLRDLLDQLDSEWATLKQDSPQLHGDDAGLLAYYHTCTRCALHWINGDPYSFQFPEGYLGERLAKLCAYLKSLQGAEQQQVKEARERTLAGLRQAWPAYRELADPKGDYPHEHYCALDDEVLPFTWEAIETLWPGENWRAEDGADARALFLPQFATQASADFHLAALAVLFLNRQCKYMLTDLGHHQTHDGRG